MSDFRANTPAPRKNSYSRRYRLTRERELAVIGRAGTRLRSGHIEARVAKSLLSYCRVAVIVAKYGHTIVERNRLRRHLRELVRTLLIPNLSGIDLLIRALPSAYNVGFKGLSVEVDRIRAQLMVNLPQS